MQIETIAAEDFDGTLQLLGRKRGVKYYYTVQALSDAGEKSDWADYVSVTYPTLEAADPTPTPIPDICLIVATHNSATLRLQAGTLSEFIGRFGETPADFTIHTARFFAGRNRSAMETPLQAPEALLPADPVPVPVGLT